VSRLQEQYKNEILPKLQADLGVTNPMSVPKIEKITINMGLGSALGDKKVLESVSEIINVSTNEVSAMANSLKVSEEASLSCSPKKDIYNAKAPKTNTSVITRPYFFIKY